LAGYISRRLDADLNFYCINNTFTHCRGSCDGSPPANPWVFNQIPEDPDAGPVLYTDGLIAASEQVPKKNDFAWMCESPALLGDLYVWIKDNLSYVEDRFVKVFTSDKSLLSLSEVFEWAPAGSNKSWVKSPGIRSQKNKLVSIIASNKRSTDGHLLRHKIVDSDPAVDAYGRGYRSIDRKEEGLDDYMFSYCIENTKSDLYYTEKIADAIACGTIPIYWGSDQIGEVYNKDGILRYEDIEDIELSEDLYLDMLPYAIENLSTLNEMRPADDVVQDKMVEALSV